MYEACPFIVEAVPLLAEVKEYNRSILKVAGSIDAAKSTIDLFTERYLQTYSEVMRIEFVDSCYNHLSNNFMICM